jgi:hypothetical protein
MSIQVRGADHDRGSAVIAVTMATTAGRHRLRFTSIAFLTVRKRC